MRPILPRLAALIIACGMLQALPHAVQAKPEQTVQKPLPRFVSLKRSMANVRVGPGLKYPIRWVYKKQGLPVEIIAEFGNWKRIRGSDGADGWINGVLLSSNRTALVSPWSKSGVNLRSRRSDDSRIIARLQPLVLVRLHGCDRTWCRVSMQKHDLQGYVHQVKLWGVYPDEIIEDRSMWGAMRDLL